MSIRVTHFILLVFQKLQVDRLVRLKLILAIFVFALVILLTEQLGHSLVVHIGDKFRLKLLLNAFNECLIFEEISLGEVVCLLQLLEDLLLFNCFQFRDFILPLLFNVVLLILCSITRQFTSAVFTTHRLLLVNISSVGSERGSVGLLEAEVVLLLKVVHFVLSLLVFVVDLFDTSIGV